MAAMVAEEHGTVAPSPEIDDLLPKGLDAETVCQEYFKACYDKESERWLACLHVERRATATTQQPGPFAVCKWDLGRLRVEKYMVKYVHTGNASDEGLENAEPVKILEFQPVYGPVPGYEEGKVLGEPIQMKLRKQGGRDGQWRVMDGTF